jgi:hypothetical protein
VIVSLRNAVQLTLRSLARRGLRATLRSIVTFPARQRELARFDAQYGTRTTDVIIPENTDPANPLARHSSTHGPTPVEHLERVFAGLPVDPRDYTFVDVGSGLGRVVLVASMQPFRAVVGVELFEAYHAIARENLERFPRALRRAGDVTLVCANAVTHDYAGGPFVFFLYQPFDAEIMAAFADAVVRAAAASSAPSFVVYYEPRHQTVWDAHPSFRLAGEGTTRELGIPAIWRTYRVEAPTGARGEPDPKAAAGR